MTRRCSHCSNNGHNSRTCPTRGGGSGGGGAAGSGGVRIFGVRLVEGSAMKKSASMSCLSHYTSLAAAQGASPNPGDSPSSDLVGDHAEAAGYASDDPSNHGSCSSGRRGERKKGTPWTEEEHRMFLVGLQKLGKGDWRGIARNFVVSRTPTQVASHAQKYFIRQTNATRRKRRSSLFDMVPDMHVDNVPEQFLVRSPSEPEIANALPSLELTLEREAAPEDPAMDKPPSELNESISCINSPTTLPPFYPAYVPVTYPYWHSLVCLPPKEAITGEAHEVFRPTPVLPKDTSHELVGMSKLSIGEAANSRIEPSALSSKLLGSSSSRQSAFHVNPAAAESDLRQSLGGNRVHVA